MGSSHKIVNITPSLFTSHLDDVVDALDEPRMGMGAFSQYMVAKAASQDYKVILAGHGGDELFSGYPVFSYAENGVLGFSNLSELSHFGYFFLSDLNSSFIKESGRKLPTLWSVRDQSRIVGLEMSNLKPWQQIDSWTKSAQSSTDGTMLTYLNAYLPGLLVVEDKISMAHSLESRTPLLDNEMIDFSLSIPASVKLNGGELKAIIKSYAKDTLPKTYFEQPKKGFPTPLRHWLRNDLTNLVSKRLTDGNSHLCEVFNPLEIQKFINEYQTSWKQHLRPFDEIQTHKMWQLLSLESWMRTWYEKYGITLRLR